MSYKQGTFFDKTWTDFDPSYNLAVLSDAEPAFPGQKELALQAFVAWLLTPKSPGREIRHAIVRSTLRSLRQAEIGALEEDSSWLRAAQTFEASELFAEAYRPIGGVNAALREGVRPTIGPRSVRPIPASLDIALEVARLFHHHAVHLGDRDQYRPASLHAASLLFGFLNSFAEKNPQERTVKNAWRFWRDRIGILYAANSFVLTPATANRYESTILVEMKRPTALIAPEDLVEAAGGARWFKSAILSRLYDAESGRTEIPSLTTIAPVELPLRQFEPTEAAAIKRAFDRKRPAT